MFPILQFGTGRFLQAHVDLFVSEAMGRGEALGPIAVVQSTESAASERRRSAFAAGTGFPVRIRGLRDGNAVDDTVVVRSIAAAWSAKADWPAILATAAREARVIVSNTADRGYELSEADDASAIAAERAPASFPAKLVVLLHRRWSKGVSGPPTILPCELVRRNGDTLCGIVAGLAQQWRLPQPFIDYVRGRCIWANSVVDRIVSAQLEPAGAVAEPYALWAIERKPGLVLPCSHPAIVLTDVLESYERRKLMLLNLGHTVLADLWIRAGRAAASTVRDAMADAAMRAHLEAVWAQEVLPVFEALGEREEARAYVEQVRDRFRNPYLEHRLSDIANNHAEKLARRVLPVIEMAGRLGLSIGQPRLRLALEGPA